MICTLIIVRTRIKDKSEKHQICVTHKQYISSPLEEQDLEMAKKVDKLSNNNENDLQVRVKTLSGINKTIIKIYLKIKSILCSEFL